MSFPNEPPVATGPCKSLERNRKGETPRVKTWAEF